MTRIPIQSGIRKSNEMTRLFLTTFVGIIFGFLLGVSFPTLSLSKSRNSQGLVSVTMKQLRKASHFGDEKSNFVINGTDVTNVTVVGMVFDIDERVTELVLLLTMELAEWLAEDGVNECFEKKEMEEIKEGMYVRVNGRLRNFQGVRQLAAFSIRVVSCLSLQWQEKQPEYSSAKWIKWKSDIHTD